MTATLVPLDIMANVIFALKFAQRMLDGYSHVPNALRILGIDVEDSADNEEDSAAKALASAYVNTWVRPQDIQ